MPTPTESITGYIRAKDSNRPHLLDAVFAADATVQMHVQTDAISFPSSLQGRDAIADTLVRRFNQTYENIYTLCIGEPPEADAQIYSCDWFVAMPYPWCGRQLAEQALAGSTTLRRVLEFLRRNGAD